MITREFDLPVDLLYQAHTDPDIIAQWMGTKVMYFDGQTNGCWRYETTNEKGQLMFAAQGVYHEVTPSHRIVRTFKMDHPDFDVQLEFLDFSSLSEETSLLRMQIIYRSVAHRENQLKLPFAYGINMAHDALQAVVEKLK
jgi:uncharacterized protein YndB with AHSA1/START domain